MTKIYCDTADIKTIKKCINFYNVDGVTTNPSIMRATGVKNYKSQCLKILKITKKNLYLLKFLLMNLIKSINKQKKYRME